MKKITSKSFPNNIKLAAFDVDGVFTDGKFFLSDDGIESKMFCTQDGYGIKQLLIANIHVLILSGRNSVSVERRMAELGVKYVFQGCKDKVSTFNSVISELKVDIKDTVYTGDDIPDINLLKHSGYSIAVANAVPKVKEICNIVTISKGGQGAVREICEYILNA